MPQESNLPFSHAHTLWGSSGLEAVTGLVFNKDIYCKQKVAQWWRTCLPMLEMQEMQVGSLGHEDPWKRKWQPTPVFLTGKSHGQRSLKGYSPWSCKESDKTEPLNIGFSDFKFMWSLNGSRYKMEHGSRYKNDIFLYKSLHADPN